jgi:hypothetical protein
MTAHGMHLQGIDALRWHFERSAMLARQQEMISSQDVRPGDEIIFNGVPHTVTDVTCKPGYHIAYRITAIGDNGLRVVFTMWAGETLKRAS